MVGKMMEDESRPRRRPVWFARPWCRTGGVRLAAVRIVSLLPSTTEILFAIGAGDEVVGVTFECDFPPEARSRRIVSTSTLPAGLTPAQIDAEVRARIAVGDDLYHLDQGALRDLRPDLVVTQDLCAVCAVDVGTVDEALTHLGCDGKVLTVDPRTLAEVLSSVIAIGKAVGREPQARRLVVSLTARLDRVAVAVADQHRPRVAVVEWTDPLFSAGHWVPDMIAAAGGISALGASGQRSTSISPGTLARCGADLVVVAPCGYDLAGAREFGGALVDRNVIPSGVPVWAVDADAVFVRPGPRLVDGIEALAGILSPGSTSAAARPRRPRVEHAGKNLAFSYVSSPGPALSSDCQYPEAGPSSTRGSRSQASIWRSWSYASNRAVSVPDRSACSTAAQSRWAIDGPSSRRPPLPADAHFART